MAVLRVGPLPGEALAAAARFHAEVLPQVRDLLAKDPHPAPLGSLTLIFPAADHGHRGWRLAAVQGLARAYAPIRVNGLASGDELAIAAALAYLERADGVTGQLLPLDGTGAGKMVSDKA